MAKTTDFRVNLGTKHLTAEKLVERLGVLEGKLDAKSRSDLLLKLTEIAEQHLLDQVQLLAVNEQETEQKRLILDDKTQLPEYKNLTEKGIVDEVAKQIGWSALISAGVKAQAKRVFNQNQADSSSNQREAAINEVITEQMRINNAAKDPVHKRYINAAMLQHGGYDQGTGAYQSSSCIWALYIVKKILADRAGEIEAHHKKHQLADTHNRWATREFNRRKMAEVNQAKGSDAAFYEDEEPCDKGVDKGGVDTDSEVFYD